MQGFVKTGKTRTTKPKAGFGNLFREWNKAEFEASQAERMLSDVAKNKARRAKDAESNRKDEFQGIPSQSFRADRTKADRSAAQAEGLYKRPGRGHRGTRRERRKRAKKGQHFKSSGELSHRSGQKQTNKAKEDSIQQANATSPGRTRDKTSSTERKPPLCGNGGGP